MKKQTALKIVCTVIMLLVVVCGFLVYNLIAGKKSAGGDVIFKCIPSAIDKISVKNSSGEYSFIKTESWTIEELKDKELVEDSIISSVNSLSLVRGDKVRDKNINPEYCSEIVVSTGENEFLFTLLKDNDKFYIKTNGKIYEVSQIWHTIAERDMNYYRDNRLNDIKSLTEGGENRFVSYNYKPSEKQAPLREITVRVKNSGEVPYFSTKSPYMLEKPYLRSVDKDIFESKVLANIPNIRIDKFIEEDAEDFSMYGLDEKSRGELTVFYDDKTFKLYIGDNAESGRVYAATDKGSAVFTIMKDWIEFINSESFEFIEKELYTYNFDYINGADIKINGKNIMLRTSQNKFYIDNNPISDETYKNFKNEISKLKISAISSGVSGEKILDMVIYGRDFRQSVYRVYKTEDKRFIVSENNKFFYYVDAVQIQEFLNYIEELQKTLI